MIPIERHRRLGWLLLLLLVDALFLWMYLSSAGLPGETATQWRHGMNGDSPLFVPGYFAVTLTLWAWSPGLPPRRLVVDALAVLLLAGALATALVTLGVQPAIESLESFAPSPRPSVPSLVRGLLTLAVWTLLVVCLRHARQTRSWRVLLVPLLGWTLLALLRPPAAFAALVREWAERLGHADRAAIVSTLMIPGLALLLGARERAS